MQFVQCVVVVVLFVLGAMPAKAGILLTATGQGQYTETGFLTSGNYATGDPITNSFQETRAFFVFDLSSVSGTIVGAELRLFNPTNGFGTTQGMTEDLGIFDVTTSVATLVGGTAGLPGFADLGSGTVFGTRTFTTADNNSTIAISLNADAINALKSASGDFAFGTAIMTLDAGFLNQREQVFGGTDAGSLVQLSLTTSDVPEPSSLTLLSYGVLGMFVGVRRKRRMPAMTYRSAS
jgi:hypothetical protein